MKVVEYTYQDGDHIRRSGIELPDTGRPDFQSCFLFSFPKAASVLANAVLGSLMAERDIPVVDLPAHLFLEGIDLTSFQCDFNELFPSHGYCFAGFRGIPISMAHLESVRSGRKILIVRDPRDILVSLYFSLKFSHQGLEARGTAQFAEVVRGIHDQTEQSLDEYCLFNSWLINAWLNFFNDILKSNDTLVVRYEDFIYDKMHLARSINDWFFLDIPADRLAEIVAPHDVIPEIDQPDDHIRQAHPGDHRRKLKPGTIAVLDALLGQFLKTFNYETTFAALPDGSDNPGADHAAHVKLIVELQEHLRKLQERAGALASERIADRQADLKRIIELQATIIGINADREARLNTIYEQQAQMRDLAGQLGDLQAHVGGINADREARLKVILDQQGQMNDLRLQIGELQAHINAVNADREARLNLIRDQQGNLAAQQDQIAGLHEALGAANAEREALLTESAVLLGTMDARLGEAEQQIKIRDVALLERDVALLEVSAALDEVGRSRWVRWGVALHLTKLRALLTQK